jgi:hypothetical protein
MKAGEQGIVQRAAVTEFDSVEQAVAPTIVPTIKTR